jgi:hypothetical protein
MPPVKRRAKGAKAPPNRWTRGEIDVLLQCLGSDEFLSKNAKTLQTRQFPPFSLRDACVKENEYHGVCVALSQEILNQAGEHNNLNLRPFASIASKILDMTAKAKASNPGLEAQALFDAFDVEAFMASSGPLGPEPPAVADPAAASSVAKGSAEGGEAAREPEPAKEDEEYDDTYVAPVRDPRNITFQTRILNPHLVCTLCMGYFNDACTAGGSKVPPLAVPELGSCASSGRTWRLWATRHREKVAGPLGAPATASDARASRLQSHRWMPPKAPSSMDALPLPLPLPLTLTPTRHHHRWMPCPCPYPCP